MTGRSKLALDDYALDMALLKSTCCTNSATLTFSGMKQGLVAMSKVRSLRIE
jgi:hypothetical protein